MRALNETYVVDTPPGTSVGHGADWLQEHLRTDYEVAWSNPVVNQYPGSSEASPIPPLRTWVDHANEQDAAIKASTHARFLYGLHSTRNVCMRAHTIPFHP